MNNNQKFLAGLILGAAAGAIVALFLQSDKGKEVVSDIKDAAAKAGEKFNESMANVNEEINDLVNKGKSFAEHMQTGKQTDNTTV
jgi:gas vesicle protein